MVKVVWTTTEIEDLDNIGEYIAKDSLKYAIITVEELFESVDILEEHPRAGPVVPEFNNDSLRQLIRKGYRIVYSIIDEQRIDILTVHSCFRLLANTKPFKEE